ncbi:hypothetical protein H483_0112690 [Dietzia sp. UCD-THP]|nr:hypothetical protein H483_0112690 [Dietzia sp. UCD-THP]
MAVEVIEDFFSGRARWYGDHHLIASQFALHSDSGDNLIADLHDESSLVSSLGSLVRQFASHSCSVIVECHVDHVELSRRRCTAGGVDAYALKRRGGDEDVFVIERDALWV